MPNMCNHRSRSRLWRITVQSSYSCKHDHSNVVPQRCQNFLPNITQRNTNQIEVITGKAYQDLHQMWIHPMYAWLHTAMISFYIQPSAKARNCESVRQKCFSSPQSASTPHAHKHTWALNRQLLIWGAGGNLWFVQEITPWPSFPSFPSFHSANLVVKLPTPPSDT